MLDWVDAVYVAVAIILAALGGGFCGGVKGFALGCRVGAMGRKSVGGPWGIVAGIVDTPEIKSALGRGIGNLLDSFGLKGKK